MQHDSDHATSEAESEAADASAPTSPMGAVASAIGSRNLIIIIVTMPIFFLVAVVALIAMFGKRGDEAQVEAAAAAAPLETVIEATPSSEAALVAVRRGGIALPEGAEIIEMSLHADRLALRANTADGGLIIIYDLRRKDVVATVPVTVD